MRLISFSRPARSAQPKSIDRAQAETTRREVVFLDASCIEPLPREPQLVRDLNLSIEEPAASSRRKQWIRYFVRMNQYDRAWDLGWDGRPFCRLPNELPDEEEMMLRERYAIKVGWKRWATKQKQARIDAKTRKRK